MISGGCLFVNLLPTGNCPKTWATTTNVALVVVFDLKGATCVHMKYDPRNTYKYWTSTVCVFCKIQSQLQRSSYWILRVHLTQLPYCNLSEIWLVWFACDVYYVTTTFKLILSLQVPNIVFLLSKIYVIHFVMASLFLKLWADIAWNSLLYNCLEDSRIVEEIFGHAVYISLFFVTFMQNSFLWQYVLVNYAYDVHKNVSQSSCLKCPLLFCSFNENWSITTNCTKTS